ncbi:MAG: hypothetical protein ACJAQ4_001772 [Cryomorphaceae bacterium]|jgi:hypothetical protein
MNFIKRRLPFFQTTYKTCNVHSEIAFPIYRPDDQTVVYFFDNKHSIKVEAFLVKNPYYYSITSARPIIKTT